MAEFVVASSDILSGRNGIGSPTLVVGHQNFTIFDASDGGFGTTSALKYNGSVGAYLESLYINGLYEV